MQNKRYIHAFYLNPAENKPQFAQGEKKHWKFFQTYAFIKQIDPRKLKQSATGERSLASDWFE